MLYRMLLVSLAVLLTACKIEIKVPTSGDVSTTSEAISCSAGQTCTVDVTDIFFDETFVAQPADGFEFKEWKTVERGLCGGLLSPCHLYTSFAADNPALMAIINDPNEVFHLQPAFQSTGFNALFIGHSFFRPFAEGMPTLAAHAGIANHTQSIVFSGGASGAPEALWNNPNKRAQIQAVLDGGDVDLFAMTYHPDYPTITGYVNWINYALAQNPNTRIVVALPWLTYPETLTTAVYDTQWHAFQQGDFQSGINFLRNQYPGTDIFAIPYGEAANELRALFDDGNLPDVTAMTANPGDAIYRDALGHADDILIELGRLIWLRAIYDVDLTTFNYDPGYITDLKQLAQDIMDAHDPNYDAPYR